MLCFAFSGGQIFTHEVVTRLFHFIESESGSHRHFQGPGSHSKLKDANTVRWVLINHFDFKNRPKLKQFVQYHKHRWPTAHHWNQSHETKARGLQKDTESNRNSITSKSNLIPTGIAWNAIEPLLTAKLNPKRVRDLKEAEEIFGDLPARKRTKRKSRFDEWQDELTSLTERLKELWVHSRRPFDGETTIPRLIGFLWNSYNHFDSSRWNKAMREEDGKAFVALWMHLSKALPILNKDLILKPFDNWNLKRIIKLWCVPQSDPKFKWHPHGAAVRSAFYKALQESDRHCNVFKPEAFGAVGLWRREKQTKEELIKKCKHCLGEFNTKAQYSPQYCEWCGITENRCHLEDVTVVGPYNTRKICPACIRSDEWVHSRNLDDLRKWEDSLELVNLGRQSLGAAQDAVFKILPESTKNKLYIKRELCSERFIVVPVRGAKTVLKEWRYQSLLNRFNSRPLNVTYHREGLFLQQAKERYFRDFGELSSWSIDGENGKPKCPWTFERKKQYDVKLGQVGNVRRTAGVVWPSLMVKSDFGKYWCGEVVKDLDGEVFDKNNLNGKRIFQEYCSACGVTDGMRMCSHGKSYKGGPSCWKQLRNAESEVQQRVLVNDATNRYKQYFKDEELETLESAEKVALRLTGARSRARNEGRNRNHVFYRGATISQKLDELNEQFEKIRVELKKLKEPEKIKTIKSNLDDYIKRTWPALSKRLDEFRLLNAILNYALYRAFPEMLCMGQYLVQGIVDGKEKGICDLMQYLPKYVVQPHVDDPGLVDRKMEYWADYALVKCNADMTQTHGRSPVFQRGEDQILCHDSRAGNGCCWRLVGDKSHPHYGGHVRLPPGTVYQLIECGVYGGITHSVHAPLTTEETRDTIERWKPFSKKMYNVVFRPW